MTPSSPSHGVSASSMMKTLSDDAKILLGGVFGVLGIPGKSKLSFGMEKSKPTERAQTALDELVKAGALSREVEGRKVEYTVQLNCSEFGKWVRKNQSKGRWPMTEPVNAHSERK